MKQQTTEFFIELCEQLADEYDLPELRNAYIVYDLKGQAAGQAVKKYEPFDGYKYFVRFNTDCFEHGTWEQVKNVVRHECSHLLCFLNPKLGKNHNKGWKSICLAIGGDGERCHDMPLPRARKVFITRHIYIIGGRSFKFTTHQHKKLQTGRCSVRGIPVKPSDHSETIKIEKKHG